MNEKLKTNLIQIFGTKVGWVWICIALVIIFGSLSSHSTFIENGYVWCDYAMLLPLGYLTTLSMIMFVYGFIINPWKKYKERKNGKP